MYSRRSLITASLTKNGFFGGASNTTLGNFCDSLRHNSSNASYFCGIYQDGIKKTNFMMHTLINYDACNIYVNAGPAQREGLGGL